MNTGDDERMRDHWWWRPGWSVGRRFYTWHLTFDGHAEVHALAAAYRPVLEAAGGLDVVPDRWLHLTTQGLGFAGEIEQGDVDAIAAAAGTRLAAIEPFTLAFTDLHVDPEGVGFRFHHPGPVRVRDAIRAAIAQVWTEVPEGAHGFTAHVTLAYSNTDAPMAPIRAAVASIPIPQATARITHADLIVLHRDRRMYQWETYATVPLGRTSR